MATYKLVISYDGTGYHGWQEQPHIPTIEGLFKKRLKQIFKNEIPFTGASRTDAGVHALGQVARCTFDRDMPSDKLQNILNNALPQGITVRSVAKVTPEFHPRIAVLQKTYYYHFFLKTPTPFISRFGVYMKNLDLERFKEALQVFKGTHDFRSFCTGDQGRTTVRTINNLDLIYFKRFGIYQVRVIGHSFLRHMIRRIVGACFDSASSKEKPLIQLVTALERKDPEQHFFCSATARALIT